MKNIKFDLFAGIDMSEEAIKRRQKENYEADCSNLENMSYWIPKIMNDDRNQNSTLKIPKTKIVSLGFEWWKWLRSDKYTDEMVEKFNEHLNAKLDGFLTDQTLFMKTGVFSNKFTFSDTVIDNRNYIGSKLLNIYYTSMLFGADKTAEVAFREMIRDKENRKQIYYGMPLHTEYRVFYDFDEKKIVGVSNYWHPELMENSLKNGELETYIEEKLKIQYDYYQYREFVTDEVAKYMEDVTELQGKWSVDVMKNGDDFWLIDMARMEYSALTQQMETI